MTRRLVCLALCVIALLGGCDVEQRAHAAPQQNVVAENERLKRELEETKRKLELQGRYTADATKTLNELQDHLSRIAILEGQVRGGTEDGQAITKSRREKMVAALQQMEASVEQQRKLIEGFRKRETQYSEKIEELGAAISRFERIIVSKNEEIARLRGDLQKATVQIESLAEDKWRAEQELGVTKVTLENTEEDLQEAQAKVESLEREVRTAHYIVSPMKFLRKHGIIVEKRTLFCSLWTVSPNLDTQKLRQIDIDGMLPLSIIAPHDRIEIISPHPLDSYTLVPESRTQSLLTITDPDRFWTTKYLVIGTR